MITGGGRGGIAEPCSTPGGVGNCVEKRQCGGRFFMASTNHLITVTIRREACLDVLELKAINFEGSQFDSLTITKPLACVGSPPSDMVAWWPWMRHKVRLRPICQAPSIMTVPGRVVGYSDQRKCRCIKL